MSRQPFRVSDALREVLDASGLPWEVRPGGSHMKLYVGRRLAAVLRRGTGKREKPTAQANVLAAVRRAVREEERK
jgi:hypothetical protein